FVLRSVATAVTRNVGFTKSPTGTRKTRVASVVVRISLGRCHQPTTGVTQKLETANGRDGNCPMGIIPAGSTPVSSWVSRIAHAVASSPEFLGPHLET